MTFASLTGVTGSSISIGRSRYSNTRRNMASEVCTSTPVDSSCIIGRNSWPCSVVKATSVPIETAPVVPDTVKAAAM